MKRREVDARATGDSLAGDKAHEFLQRLDRGGNLDRARAVAVWREVAGAEVACHAMGFAMRGSELVVYVDSPVWATELSGLSEHYRSDINAAVGKELVRSMRFAVSKKVSEELAWEEAHGGATAAVAERVEPVPATDQERSQIEAMAAGIHNETLREAAVRAAICGLEWRKGAERRKSSENAVQSVADHENRS